MSKVYFTADSHYGHKNIVKALSSWTDKDQCREFSTLEEMNNELVRGINSVVRADDTLYHIGDFNFGGIKNQREFRSRLVCENIHLILGNHDFNHGTIDPTTVDHQFSSVSSYKEIVVEGQEIVLNHYAQRVWNNQGKGSWHLYGHSHGTLEWLKNYSIDVGVEGLGKFNSIPWDMEGLRSWFLANQIVTGDHHNEHTQNPRFRR